MGVYGLTTGKVLFLGQEKVRRDAGNGSVGNEHGAGGRTGPPFTLQGQTRHGVRLRKLEPELLGVVVHLLGTFQREGNEGRAAAKDFSGRARVGVRFRHHGPGEDGQAYAGTGYAAQDGGRS